MNTSRIITSSQTTIHQDLISVVDKHNQTEFKKPYRPFSEEIFASLQKIIANDSRPLILDSGCGNGNSTKKLASLYPEHLVIGIDKSAARLNHVLENENIYQENNLIYVRTDLVDFYRQAASANWQLDKHFLFYPNPWPKPEQLKRRWHGHPIFKDMLALGGEIELRTNWQIYADEFATAMAHVIKTKIYSLEFTPENIVSPFEQKYLNSGHKLYLVRAKA